MSVESSALKDRLHVEWGSDGADAVSTTTDVAVVVDVLSFTTSVSVAVDRGIEVLPYTEYGSAAQAYAGERDAVVANLRQDATGTGISLSPVSIRRAVALPPRLVLPSPNGSTIARRLHLAGVLVLAACLRNGRAVATWIAEHQPGAAIAVIAAGERWPHSGRLRPAVEDLWGAGAVVTALYHHGWRDLSPEAETAMHSVPTPPGTIAALLDCASGRELVHAGFRGDVLIAGEVDASDSVPLLDGDRFVSAHLAS